MFLYRVAATQFAVSDVPGRPLRSLLSDPFRTSPEAWELGGALESSAPLAPLAPIIPGKIVGIGRNYKEHVKELSSPMPAEPLIFLKAPSSLIGPGEAVVLPPESERVEHEGEIAVVVGRRLKRATEAEARRAVFGITAVCDVTARDLQRKDPTFARAKSFDTFCPLGPAVWVGADPEDLEVITRVNGVERQRGHTREMTWGIVDLLVYTSRMMTLEPGDLILTGTPAGVGFPKRTFLAVGDRIDAEIAEIGKLSVEVGA